ncbi:hypothetical protein AYI69_g2075 [Smittium culicis]|uniref:Uncharacterized protein n=1 Tax=Smittium culicis TaxID=133412 RepID=A0A1R1YNF2_9FUNG|nr:hypothetical protein AYI69_g2075 [Smittium culicis]
MAENKSTPSSSEIFADSFNIKNDTPKIHAQSSQQQSSSGSAQNINEKTSRLEHSSISQKLKYKHSESKSVKNNTLNDYTKSRSNTRIRSRSRSYSRSPSRTGTDHALTRIQGRLSGGADTDHAHIQDLIKGRIGIGSILVRIRVHILLRDHRYPNQRVLGATIILKGSQVNTIFSKKIK